MSICIDFCFLQIFFLWSFFYRKLCLDSIIFTVAHMLICRVSVVKFTLARLHAVNEFIMLISHIDGRYFQNTIWYGCEYCDDAVSLKKLGYIFFKNYVHIKVFNETILTVITSFRVNRALRSMCVSVHSWWCPEPRKCLCAKHYITIFFYPNSCHETSNFNLY